MEYNFAEIEPKWQKYWDDHQTFKVEVDPSKPKYYVLDMFPYPSGAGLHVGHPEGYTATDIMARYKRMKGFNVLHPMGWDSFGLPAENYAIKTGIHPEVITQKNIATFKRQLKMLGFSYDWSREIATSDLKYYRWTQWIFMQLYRQGLAYEDEMLVNWCPALKTVLANEEVVNGKSEVGGHPVIRTPMKQWVLRITKYADRLLEDLDLLDWPENIKEMQRNWIGRSVGASVIFTLAKPLPGTKAEDDANKLEVFTTRADTLFGATYMVLAPEHPLVEKIVTPEQKAAVEEYKKMTAAKSDLERTDLNKDKTGVFSGAYAVNPVNGKEIPIWIADYVLINYGTGAIMAVPAHDTRDWEFAKKFNIPLIPVIEGGDINVAAYVDDGKHINSGFLDGMGKQEAIDKMIAWLQEKKCGAKKVNYKLRDWIFSRQRYWGEPFPLLKFADGTIRCLEEDELPVALPEVEKYEPTGTGESPLAAMREWVEVTDPKTGKKALRETNTMPQWAGSCWYYLRYLDPQNQEKAWDKTKEKYWMPVDLYVGGVEHAVLHLLYARFWHKVLYDLGLVSTKEPFHKLVNQGLILGPNGEKMSKSRGNVINPDDVVRDYGADTLRAYEMFMGPLDKVKPWSMQGVEGVFRFLQKAYRLFLDDAHWLPETEKEDLELTKMLHKTIKKVGEDIEEMHFNTAISQLMIFNNLAVKKGKVHPSTAKTFALLLAPFAPHFAEELWSKFQAESIAYAPWPTFDPELAADDLIDFPIQVNGKTRAILNVAQDIAKDDLLAQAKADPRIQKFLTDKTIVKEVFVPGKICNLVIK